MLKLSTASTKEPIYKNKVLKNLFFKKKSKKKVKDLGINR
mgnify:CR=1 FL=1